MNNKTAPSMNVRTVLNRRTFLSERTFLNRRTFPIRRSLLLLVFLALSWYGRAQQFNFDTAAVIKNSPSLYSLVISVADSIRYQKNFNGTSASELRNNQSLTKSISALLVGIAIDKGYIPSVDEKIIRWFPELKQDPDTRKQAITLRQIMNQASGLSHEDLNSPTGVPDYLSLKDPSGYVLHGPLLTVPGDSFQYNNAASHLVSLIISRSSGMNTLDFANKFLFGPLGITSVGWPKLNDGYYDGGGLLSVRLRSADLVKIGSLLLHDGRYGSRQIVPAKWVKEIIDPSVQYDTPWGFHVSRYGLFWYHKKYKGTDLIYALGWGGQFLLVIPAFKAVIAVNEDPDAISATASVIFVSRIFPLIFDDLRLSKMQ